MSASPSPTRSERYLARVDAHIACLPADARRAFLRSKLAAWDRKYAAWLTATERGLPPPADTANATAWDFRETLDGLVLRQHREAA